MKIIINCEPDELPEAVSVVTDQLTKFNRYNRIGWGWRFGGFFVRRIKDGLSITSI